MANLLEKLLTRDEDYRKNAYKDSLGYLTIGIGRLIDPRKPGGISIAEAVFMLRNDISDRLAALTARLPWFKDLDEVRQAVLVSMSFQLGVSGLLGFMNTLEAVRTGRYDQAANLMLTSKWAEQTPNRAQRLAKAMRSGSADAFELDTDPPPVDF